MQRSQKMTVGSRELNELCGHCLENMDYFPWVDISKNDGGVVEVRVDIELAFSLCKLTYFLNNDYISYY